jgi:hypothetical protein
MLVVTTAELVELSVSHEDHRHLKQRIQCSRKTNDWSPVNFDCFHINDECAEPLFQVIADVYQQRLLIIATSLLFSWWADTRQSEDGRSGDCPFCASWAVH